MAHGTAAVGRREVPLSSVRQYFDIAADRLRLHPEMRWLLSVPFREMTVELPLRRDDTRLQLFRGFRVQHNGVRGPLIGPVRFQSGLELNTLRAAAESMTWRCALANVPFGGAAGGVACDSAKLSPGEFEHLVRRYGVRMKEMLGIYHDVCMPGPSAAPQTMLWIAEECSTQTDSLVPVLGKPVQNGGLASDRLIGRATAKLITQVAENAGLSIERLRVAVSSLDGSAFHTAVALDELGCVVVAVSESGSGLHCSPGIDMQALADHVAMTGSFTGFEGAAETVDIHALDCDVLVLGASEGTLNHSAATDVQAKLVVETSELVITPDVDHYLASRGVLVIPDLIGSAAWVLAANAEWSNAVQRLSPAEDKMEHEIETALVRIYEQVCERARRDQIGLRTAAYSQAIERVARCERLRVA